jgi:hypothetical protein
MHPNFDNAHKNVVNHVSNAHSAFAGHSVACVDATSKRLLGRKRLSTQPSYQPADPTSARYQADDSMSGDRPDMSSPRDSMSRSSMRDPMSRGERLATRTRSLRTQTWREDAPAAIWAALVIAKALAS